MDVGGHFCPFALGLMIGFTEKNAKEEAETSLLNSPPLLLRGYIRMSLESPLPSSPTTLGSVTQPIPNGCCGPPCIGMAYGELYGKYQKHIILATLPSFSRVVIHNFCYSTCGRYRAIVSKDLRLQVSEESKESTPHRVSLVPSWFNYNEYNP